MTQTRVLLVPNVIIFLLLELERARHLPPLRGGRPLDEAIALLVEDDGEVGHLDEAEDGVEVGRGEALAHQRRAHLVTCKEMKYFKVTILFQKIST